MSPCDGRPLLIKLLAGVKLAYSDEPQAQMCASGLGQAGRAKEMFTTAVDSPVYSHQHPSLDANLHSLTKKILGDIKIECACVNMHAITVSP